jgi:hypothetical protein
MNDKGSDNMFLANGATKFMNWDIPWEQMRCSSMNFPLFDRITISSWYLHPMRITMAKLKKKKDADKVPENKNRSDSKGSKPSSIVTAPEKGKKKK